MVFVRVKSRDFAVGSVRGGRGLNSSEGAWVGMGDPVCRVEPRRQGGSVGRSANSFPMVAVVVVAGHIGVSCGRSVGQVGSVGHWWYIRYQRGHKAGKGVLANSWSQDEVV